MKKTYKGSCHCGAVGFECDIDLAAGTRRCNCSFCAKARFWKIFALKGEFRLLRGGDSLADYQASSSEWPKGDVHHYFCKTCGMRPFSKGFLQMAPFNGEFHAVNIACLDDASDEELANAPIQYEDGRDNRWESAPAETRHI